MALEHGGRDAVVVVERLAGTSAVTQRISLGPGADSLAITTAVDWQESEKLLKLGFALDVRADRSAAETQFGHVFRPTHLNTSWEAAKFEICAHRWIHVAEPGYGVAISNSSTYGHDVTRNIREDDGGTTTTVRLSLLRAPKFPDPGADRGRHELTRHDPARRQHRRRRGGGLPHQPGAAGGQGRPRRGAAVTGLQPGPGH